MDKNYMMADLETLAISSDAVVLSAGIVIFNLKGDILDEYYEEFTHSDQLLEGRTVLKDTVDWWRRTNYTEFSRLLRAGKASAFTLGNDAQSMYKGNNCKSMWQRGNMDYPILESLGFSLPFYSLTDCRTLDVFEKMEVGNNHNALDDCKNQVNHVVSVAKRYFNKE